MPMDLANPPCVQWLRIAHSQLAGSSADSFLQVKGDTITRISRIRLDFIATADAVLSSPLSDITKSKDKALHTFKIVKAEVLSDIDKLSCNVFECLASIGNSACTCPNGDFNQIQLESVTIICKYVEQYYPNAVRVSAGTIVSSFSALPEHATMVYDMFFVAQKRR
jgi:hypothetical protein